MQYVDAVQFISVQLISRSVRSEFGSVQFIPFAPYAPFEWSQSSRFLV